MSQLGDNKLYLEGAIASFLEGKDLNDSEKQQLQKLLGISNYYDLASKVLILDSSIKDSILNSSGESARYMDDVAIVKNLATDPILASDAIQETSSNRGRYLPLIEDKGYLHCTGVDGNFVEFDQPLLPSRDDFELEIDFLLTSSPSSPGDRRGLFSQSEVDKHQSFFVFVDSDGSIGISYNNFGLQVVKTNANLISPRSRHQVWVKRTENTFRIFIDGKEEASTEVLFSILQRNSVIGGLSGGSSPFSGVIFSTHISTSQNYVNVDFTDDNIAHTSSGGSFLCETQQTVNLNTSGTNPLTLVRHPGIRMDGVDDFFRGTFTSALGGGRLFLVFDVLGSGATNARVFTSNKNGTRDFRSDQSLVWSLANTSTSGMATYYNGNWYMERDGKFNGRLLHEVQSEGKFYSRLNGRDEKNNSLGANSLALQNFNIASDDTGLGSNAAIDFHALELYVLPTTQGLADYRTEELRRKWEVY